MSSQVDTALVQGYSSAIAVKFQQMRSRLIDSIDLADDFTGERQSFDRVLPTTASDDETRHGDTILTDTPHDRRWVTPKPAYVADMVDRADKLRMLTDPSSSYLANMVAAINRKIDDRIYTAALGNAESGKNGGTDNALPAAQIIAVDYVESGTATDSSLTVGKLRRARTLLTNAEVFGDDGDTTACIVCSPYEIEALLQDTEVTSADYNSVRALVNGEIDSYMGFKFITRASSTFTLSSGDRQIIAYARKGIVGGMKDELFTRIEERPDKRHNFQVYAETDCGFVRQWEDAVVSILCNV